MSSCQKICECGLIDWSEVPGKYKYISTGALYQPFIGTEETGISLKSKKEIDCQAKVNMDLMDLKEYNNICQYIPGGQGSKFPDIVYKKLFFGEY